MLAPTGTGDFIEKVALSLLREIEVTPRGWALQLDNVKYHNLWDCDRTKFYTFLSFKESLAFRQALKGGSLSCTYAVQDLSV